MQSNPWAATLFLAPNWNLVPETFPRPTDWGSNGKNSVAGSDPFNLRCHFMKGELHFLNMNERRRVPRYSAHVEASIKLPGENTALAVMVEDLCILGCMLESSPPLEVRQECEFVMSWKGREFQTPAVVAWRSDHGQMGVEFLNTVPAKLQLLREICSDFIMKPLVRLSKDLP
jgi:hypothetical protein